MGIATNVVRARGTDTCSANDNTKHITTGDDGRTGNIINTCRRANHDSHRGDASGGRDIVVDGTTGLKSYY